MQYEPDDEPEPARALTTVGERCFHLVCDHLGSDALKSLRQVAVATYVPVCTLPTRDPFTVKMFELSAAVGDDGALWVAKAQLDVLRRARDAGSTRYASLMEVADAPADDMEPLGDDGLTFGVGLDLKVLAITDARGRDALARLLEGDALVGFANRFARVRLEITSYASILNMERDERLYRRLAEIAAQLTNVVAVANHGCGNGEGDAVVWAALAPPPPLPAAFYGSYELGGGRRRLQKIAITSVPPEGLDFSALRGVPHVNLVDSMRRVTDFSFLCASEVVQLSRCAIADLSPLAGARAVTLYFCPEAGSLAPLRDVDQLFVLGCARASDADCLSLTRVLAICGDSAIESFRFGHMPKLASIHLGGGRRGGPVRQVELPAAMRYVCVEGGAEIGGLARARTLVLSSGAYVKAESLAEVERFWLATLPNSHQPVALDNLQAALRGAALLGACTADSVGDTACSESRLEDELKELAAASGLTVGAAVPTASPVLEGDTDWYFDFFRPREAWLARAVVRQPAL